MLWVRLSPPLLYRLGSKAQCCLAPATRAPVCFKTVLTVFVLQPFTLPTDSVDAHALLVDSKRHITILQACAET